MFVVKGKVTVLTDIPDWASTTVESLNDQGWMVEVVDVRQWNWIASERLPGWGLAFNRIAARPADADMGLLTKTRDLLAAVDLAGIPCLNGARCHAIGASKSSQASLFVNCGVPTPWTQLVSTDTLGEKLAGIDHDFPLLIKANVGGRGQGISSVEDIQEETFAADGCAILQERIETGDGRIHRVEMLGGKVLYEATIPLKPNAFDYCLSEANDDSLKVSTEVSEDVASHCQRIAERASLDLGSIEYLLDQRGVPRFIDINPVSSFVPNLGQHLEVDPFRMISELLASRVISSNA